MTTRTKTPATGQRRTDKPVRRVEEPKITNRARESTKKNERIASAPSKRGVNQPEKVSAERRHRMIAETAFLRAEKRGFQGGDPVSDWLEAEKAVDRALTG